MVSRKRNHSETGAAPKQPPEGPGLLHRLRNSWEFANLMQYISMFGKLMKIDENFGIEDLETECLKPTPSEKLLEIGLCLLKWISSHRGLTFDNFDEYTRRQYNAKAPHLPNPFGHDEVPNRFLDFDVFLKLRVLHQLSVWTFWNPDRIREKMPEQRETDQTIWRIEELGYDSEDRYYYVLDDNRLYRLTFPPIPPPKSQPKSRSRNARAMRASKRRRVSEAAGEDSDEANTNASGDSAKDPMDGMKWECIAVTLAEYQGFLNTIQKTRDPNEKVLRNRLHEQVMPIIEKEEEAQQRQIAKREKELLNMELLAGAKRSSRLAGKMEKERQEREAEEEALRRQAELAAARKEEAKQRKMEQDRESRVNQREQRIKERERKRIEHEEELERITAEQEKLERGESRMSERNLKAELERRRKDLEDISQDDQWIFDCSGCGVHGENLDDGSHSVACERCNVWQHSKCLGIGQDEAEQEDFHFICRDCKRQEEEAKLPKLPLLKFRVDSASNSPSAEAQHQHQPQEQDLPSPSKKPQGPGFTKIQNGSPAKPSALPPSLSTTTAQPLSPERRRSQPVHRFSPSKGANGFGVFSKNPVPTKPSGQPPLPPVQQSLSRRPSTSNSVQHPFSSPVQNRLSMSPTQGNRDVGPLAGFPAGAPSNGAPWTPYGQHQASRSNGPTRGASSSFQSNPPSFSAATPSNPQSSPPQSSHGGMSLSGISPTKNSPRPMTSGSITGAPILPPIQKLEPSPKLMGRSSPDAPIPAPVKCMTPEQEERRQRENSLMMRGRNPSQGQGPSLMSSPSLNRIPPLGPSAVAPQSTAESGKQQSPTK